MIIKTRLLLALVMISLASIAFAQNGEGRRITGTVKDEKGASLPGITVTEKGTSNAVATNEKGGFSIRVKQVASLVFTAVGFEAQELKVTVNTLLAITLKDDTKALSDVVVVGYGIQKKEILGERPVSTTASLLQGVTPGLQVTIGSGRPGEGASLNIRGATGFGSALNSSIATGAPLILVDNTVYDMPLNSIDPNDIETVSILKDAGAAAIYGARSAFGVILIQTKKGKKNQKPQFNFSNNIIFASPTNLPEKATPKRSIQALLDGGLTNYSVGQGQDLKKWIQYFDDYEANPGKFPNGYVMDNGVFYNLKGNNAVDELLGNSTMQMMNNLSVAGGSDKTTYRISLGSTNENGIMVPAAHVDNYKRYNVKSIITSDITNWMNVQLDALYAYTNTTTPGYSDPYTYAIRIPSFLAGDSIPYSKSYRPIESYRQSDIETIERFYSYR
jgi:TonB-dependent SusC/RagA subfamily outer membrane receptor